MRRSHCQGRELAHRRLSRRSPAGLDRHGTSPRRSSSMSTPAVTSRACSGQTSAHSPQPVHRAGWCRRMTSSGPSSSRIARVGQAAAHAPQTVRPGLVQGKDPERREAASSIVTTLSSASLVTASAVAQGSASRRPLPPAANSRNSGAPSGASTAIRASACTSPSAAVQHTAAEGGHAVRSRTALLPAGQKADSRRSVQHRLKHPTRRDQRQRRQLDRAPAVRDGRVGIPAGKDDPRRRGCQENAQLCFELLRR